MHSQYLRACYLHNAIVKPGAFTIGDTPIDLGKIETPLYVLGAENDHIAPWRATYLTTQHVGGEAKYVLTNSGHIAGIVNPPGGKKTWHYTKPSAARAARAPTSGSRPPIVTTARGGKIGRSGPTRTAARCARRTACPKASRHRGSTCATKAANRSRLEDVEGGAPT